LTQDDRQQAAVAVWGASPAGSAFADGAAPGTREFFERVLRLRSTYEMPWLPDVVPFATFRGRRVLELGCGAGYDAYELCRAGAIYTGIDITPENILLTRQHLGFFGFEPNVEEADAERLPFPDGSFDVVYSNGVLHHTPDISKAIGEAYRVLRPGGVFYVIVYHRDSIFYWLTLRLVDHFLRGGYGHRSFKERLAMVEYTTSDQLPLVNVYSRRQIGELLAAVGFHPRGTRVRKLVPEDLPEIPVLRRMWSHLSQRWLDRVGLKWGWYLIAFASKARSNER
jgi:ubiquinone/menaquinone biosynthesis C-methylase UbiE